MTGIRFCGTGSYLPPLTVDNGEYAKIVDTSDEWIRPRTGIVTRGFHRIVKLVQRFAQLLIGGVHG